MDELRKGYAGRIPFRSFEKMEKYIIDRYNTIVGAAVAVLTALLGYIGTYMLVAFLMWNVDITCRTF